MDVTSLVIEAQDARSRMQEAKSRIKYEVRRKYEAQMKREVEEASQDAEIEFARTLARVNAAGVPQHILRSEVLRTNVWSRWTYWRDLAGIEPDRISVSNAKKETARANSPFRWADDYSTLTVLKYGDTTLDEPVVYDMSTNRVNPVMHLYWPDPFDESVERVAWTAAGGSAAWVKHLDAEIRSQIAAGNVAEPA